MLVTMKTNKTVSRNSKTQVLLVEDNDINRLLLCDFLRHYDYAITSLPDGENFFETLAAIRADVILLDLKLRTTDGFQILQQLQASPIYRHIPVIVVSGLAFKSDQQRAFALGARHYLVKPINLNELGQLIQEEIGRSCS